MTDGINLLWIHRMKVEECWASERTILRMMMIMRSSCGEKSGIVPGILHYLRFTPRCYSCCIVKTRSYVRRSYHFSQWQVKKRDNDVGGLLFYYCDRLWTATWWTDLGWSRQVVAWTSPLSFCTEKIRLSFSVERIRLREKALFTLWKAIINWRITTAQLFLMI